MKKLFALIAGLLIGLAGFAQSAEEILSRMEKTMDGREDDGLIMTIDIKIPVLGTMSTKTWSVGDKMRMELSTMGENATTWVDNASNISWTYDSGKNTVTIDDTSS